MPGTSGTKRGGAFPQHVRSDQIAHEVRTMSELAVPVRDIAKIVKLSLDTVMKYYRDEWEEGFAVGNVRLMKSTFDQAVGRPAEYDPATGKLIREELKPTASVLIFALKNRVGWTDHQKIEHSGPGGGPIPTANNVDLSIYTDEEFELLEKLRKKAFARQQKEAAEKAGTKAADDVENAG